MYCILPPVENKKNCDTSNRLMENDPLNLNVPSSLGTSDEKQIYYTIKSNQ